MNQQDKAGSLLPKLELKHLSPYLPYGLKCYSENIHPIREITVQDSLSSWILWMTVNKSKLLLRPLSDLTKEIEVNGEKFVPIEWFEENDYYEWQYIKFMDYINPLTLPYCWIQKLYEWHFAIDIPEHLYIDINTITNG